MEIPIMIGNVPKLSRRYKVRQGKVLSKTQKRNQDSGFNGSYAIFQFAT